MPLVSCVVPLVAALDREARLLLCLVAEKVLLAAVRRFELHHWLVVVARQDPGIVPYL